MTHLRSLSLVDRCEFPCTYEKAPFDLLFKGLLTSKLHRLELWVTRLGLNGCHVYDEDSDVILAALKRIKLTPLSLSRNTISEANQVKIILACKGSTLKVLDLRGNHYGSDHASFQSFMKAKPDELTVWS
jgi:hypothetical protein